MTHLAVALALDIWLHLLRALAPLVQNSMSNSSIFGCMTCLAKAGAIRMYKRPPRVHLLIAIMEIQLARFVDTLQKN